jgi:hypothetical protein
MKFERFVFMQNNEMIVELFTQLQKQSLPLPSPYLIPLSFDLVRDTIASSVIIKFYYMNHEPAESVIIEGQKVLIGINSNKLIEASTNITNNFSFENWFSKLFSSNKINKVSSAVCKFALTKQEKEVKSFFLNGNHEGTI